MIEIAGGPPIITGMPLGIASTVDDGRRTGSPQLIDLSPMRTALTPIKFTVCEPKTLIASPSGATGGPGAGGGPLNDGFGSFGIGAHAVPGGIRMWGTPSVLMALVPTVVAGKPLISTGPSGGGARRIPPSTPIPSPTRS